MALLPVEQGQQQPQKSALQNAAQVLGIVSSLGSLGTGIANAANGATNASSNALNADTNAEILARQKILNPLPSPSVPAQAPMQYNTQPNFNLGVQR